MIKKYFFYIIYICFAILFVSSAMLFIENTVYETKGTFMKKETDRLKGKALVTANLAASSINNDFEALFSMESPDFISGTLAKQKEILRLASAAAPDKYMDIILIGTDGKTFWSQSGKAPKTYEKNELFKAAKAGSSTYFIEHAKNLPPIYLTVKPVMKDGKFKAAVILRLNLAKMAETINTMAFPYDSVYLTDENYTIITDSLGLAATKPSMKLPLNILVGSDEELSPECDDCSALTRSAKIPALGWTVFVTSDQKPFYQGMVTTLRLQLFFLGFFIIASILILQSFSLVRFIKAAEFLQNGSRRLFGRPHNAGRK